MEFQDKDITIISDEQIVELYWQRNEQAIEQTDNKYRNFLISVAYNIVYDTNDCEECLNDTYIDAWNSIPPSKPISLQAFLATIMRRTAIDCYKAKNRQKRITSELSVSLSEVEDFIADNSNICSEINAKELGSIISDFVRSLSKRRMYIFMSRYYIARPITEISKLLRCSESTVNKEIAKIKHELKERLEKEGYIL